MDLDWTWLLLQARKVIIGMPKSKIYLGIFMVCGLGLVFVLTSLYLPSLMKAPSQAERMNALGRQELSYLYNQLTIYKHDHAGALPNNLIELQRATGYLEGVSKDIREQKMAAITYPLQMSINEPTTAIAAYKINDNDQLLLLMSGQVVKASIQR